METMSLSAPLPSLPPQGSTMMPSPQLLEDNSKNKADHEDDDDELLDDFVDEQLNHVLQSVCSSNYWDDMAEDYVDQAGRACLENSAMIVTTSTGTTATTHSSLRCVTVDTVGMIGIRVNRRHCRDLWDEHNISPPAQVRLVVSLMRQGEIFATTPVSQCLQAGGRNATTTTTSHHGDNARDDYPTATAASDISSLASTLDGTTIGGEDDRDGNELTASLTHQNLVAIWGGGDDTARGGEPSAAAVTFDTCLDVHGEKATSSSSDSDKHKIEILVSLVDCRPEWETCPTIPLAIGSFSSVHDQEKDETVTTDIALHDVLPHQTYPTLSIVNPHFVGKHHQHHHHHNHDRSQAATMMVEDASGIPSKTGGGGGIKSHGSNNRTSATKKKKRGLKKLFSSRSKKHYLMAEEQQEEEKKEDDGLSDHHQDVPVYTVTAKTACSVHHAISSSLPTPSSSLPLANMITNQAYTLDEVQGAFLRYKVEWKEKESNFEVNLQEDSAAASNIAQSSPSASVLLEKENSIRHVDAQHEAAEQIMYQQQRNSDVDASISTTSAAQDDHTETSSSKTKKQKSKSFFFKKKKIEDSTTESVAASTASPIRSSKKSVQRAEKESRQEEESDQKAALLREIRAATPLPDVTANIEVPVRTFNNEKSTSIRDQGGNDDETAHSVFDIMYNAMVGQKQNPATSTATSKDASRSKEKMVFAIGHEISLPPNLEEITANQDSLSIEGDHEHNDDDDATAHSIFDSTTKAVAGPKTTTSVVQRPSEQQDAAAVAEQQPTFGGYTEETIQREMTPAENAFCEVMQPVRRSFDQIRSVDVERKGHPADTAGESSLQSEQPSLQKANDAGFEGTSDSGLYAQFVQATSAFMSHPHVEFKKVENHGKEPTTMPALKENLRKQDPEKAPSPSRGNGPVDIDKMEEGEIYTDEDMSPPKTKRTATPSPGDLSMERVLSWDAKSPVGQGPKESRFRFGRRRRSGSVGESPTNSFKPSTLRNKGMVDEDQKLVATSAANPEDVKASAMGSVSALPRVNAVLPVSHKQVLKPPSSLPRHPRENAKPQNQQHSVHFSKGSKAGSKERENGQPKQKRKFWGKIFKNKSSNQSQTFVLKEDDTPEPTLTTAKSNASVVSDADTVEIDNIAQESLLKALQGDVPGSPSSVAGATSGKQSVEDESAFVDQEEKKETPTASSWFNLFGAGFGSEEDIRDVWHYARDDETQFTRETQTSKVDDLTLIPSPADLLLSETYHKCGPAKIADLGDALIEETRCFAEKVGVRFLADRSDGETYATFTFDEPTFDPSLVSADGRSDGGVSKSRSDGGASRSATSRMRSSPEPSPQTTPPSPESRAPPATAHNASSPKGVADFDGHNEQPSKVETFSEAFANFLMCRPHNAFSERDDSTAIPKELIRTNDTDSVDDLTLTTYEMQVEIEHFKKKIEETRNQAEILDENGEEADGDAALVFQSPDHQRRTTPNPSFQE